MFISFSTNTSNLQQLQVITMPLTDCYHEIWLGMSIACFWQMMPFWSCGDIITKCADSRELISPKALCQQDDNCRWTQCIQQDKWLACLHSWTNNFLHIWNIIEWNIRKQGTDKHKHLKAWIPASESNLTAYNICWTARQMICLFTFSLGISSFTSKHAYQTKGDMFIFIQVCMMEDDPSYMRYITSLWGCRKTTI